MVALTNVYGAGKQVRSILKCNSGVHTCSPLPEESSGVASNDIRTEHQNQLCMFGPPRGFLRDCEL